MTQLPTPSDEDLHAFIDGELDAARAMKVAAALQRDPALADKVSAFNADKLRLREVFGPLAEEPLPAAWTAMIAAHASREGQSTAERKTKPWNFIAANSNLRRWAAAAAIVLMAGAGWQVYRGAGYFGERANEAVITEALAAHADTLKAPPATILQEDPSVMMSSTLGHPLKAPDLSKMGYALAAVQVYANQPGGKAMKLDYRDATNHLFTLYLKPSPGSPRFDMLKRGDERICVWQDDVLSTIMVGEMSAAEMLRLASLAYAGLT